MFDVFTEEIELIIKDGIANLYWYHADLKKAWLRSGVDQQLCDSILNQRREDGGKLSKRQLMDLLYEHLRQRDFDRRLEVSRNFVRILIEHRNFVPQDEKHRIDVAERSALKLREMIAKEDNERESREQIQRKAAQSKAESYSTQLTLVRELFIAAKEMPPQQRGYELEKIFTKLMTISNIPVGEGFRIEGEQIDGSIKHDGHYYLIEAKWTEAKTEPKDVGSFYYKVDGKMEGRGILISMNGYTDGVLASLPRGKDIRVLLLDGTHLANVIYGIYSFQELLDHAISHASLKASIYCPHNIRE